MWLSITAQSAAVAAAAQSERLSVSTQSILGKKPLSCWTKPAGKIREGKHPAEKERGSKESFPDPRLSAKGKTLNKAKPTLDSQAKQTAK